MIKDFLFYKTADGHYLFSSSHQVYLSRSGPGRSMNGVKSYFASFEEAQKALDDYVANYEVKVDTAAPKTSVYVLYVDGKPVFTSLVKMRVEVVEV